MARLFNLEVINGILLGGDESPIYSSTELQGTLGTMDVFHMEITVEAVSENSTTVTVKYETSNDGKTWYAVTGAAKDLTVATAGSGPAGVAWDVSDMINGAYGRFKAYSDKSTAASVRVIVCGRSR